MLGHGSPISGHSLEVRTSEASSRRFSSAAAIAQVLDPTNQRLSELLSSGSARNLSEAFQQLNPSEQNNLRERWGRSLDELISLASERDATIFHHGLLEVGHRLEDADQLELAGVVYSALVAGNSPRPPLNLRGGEENHHVSPSPLGGEGARRADEGTAPAGILASAQARLNAMNGVGDWRARLAFNLERLPSNATRWDMLFAMGGAGLVFRGVRLAATARWASSFESAFALNAAATSTAFFAETAAFTGFGRIFGTMAGNHYDWSTEGTFNEWAGGAAMLLGLKAMGGVFGNLSERWAAGETAFARVTRAVAPQAGMFSGIVLGNRLAELGGFHPERHGDTWLTDGLTTLLEFNIAGRLQRSAGGPGLTNLEGRMEAYTRSLASSEFAAVSRSKDRLLRGMGNIFSPASLTPEGFAMSVPEKNNPLYETTVFSIAHDGAGSGSGTATGTHRLESRFRNGSVIVEILTEPAITEARAEALLKRRDDAISTLLLGYRSRNSDKLRGPVADLLREDPALQSQLVRHLERHDNRLVVSIDQDSGILQHLFGIDALGRPVLALLSDAISGSSLEGARILTVYRTQTTGFESGSPKLKTWAYRYDAELNGRLRQPLTLENYWEDTSPLSLEWNPAHPERWKLQNGGDTPLLSIDNENLRARVDMKRPPLSTPPPPRRAKPRIAPEPPAIILQTEKPIEPPVQRGAETLLPPPPEAQLAAAIRPTREPGPPRIEPETLAPDQMTSLAKKLIGSMPRDLTGAPILAQTLWIWAEMRMMVEGTSKMRPEIFEAFGFFARKIPQHQIGGFFSQTAEDFPLLFSEPRFNCMALSNLIRKIPQGGRELALQYVASYLDQTGAIAPNAFDILRHVIPALQRNELFLLRRFLENHYPAKEHQTRQTSMVYQTRRYIEETLK